MYTFPHGALPQLVQENVAGDRLVEQGAELIEGPLALVGGQIAFLHQLRHRFLRPLVARPSSQAILGGRTLVLLLNDPAQACAVVFEFLHLFVRQPPAPEQCLQQLLFFDVAR